MPNIKSQIKRDQTNKAANEKNSAAKSELRTAIKKVESYAAAADKENATVALRAAIALLDQASQAGIISANSANRKKSHLAKVVNAIA
ncbi:MAG: 30S ribosomal protein S20 [Bacilli bacterium]|nr:30S ribosomal protein S20 [Bacilli bacterium]